MSTRVTAIMLVALIFRSPVMSQTMDIVRQGRAVAVIVADKAGEGPAQREAGEQRRKRTRGFECNDLAAANVLADWVEKISGVRLAIVSQAPASGSAVYVGSAAVKAGLNLGDIDSPTREGLRIIGDGQAKIFIAGQNDTSTMKAVCRFLEELGCRYFMDNELGEVYPRRKTISVPEYFALRDGQRRKGGWYCTSNPELRKIFTQGVISKGGTNPSVSPPDGTGYCQCEACRAQDDPDNIEPSSGRASMTNRYVDFLDEVARDIAKAHPDWLLSFYCYADYTQPPTLNRALSPNLVAWIAPIRYSRYHRIGSPSSASRRQLAQVIDGWSAAAEHIAYRTYNYNLAECLVPFSKLSVWKHDIPYLAKKGCIGINLESLANWEIYGPHLYQSVRLAYYPDADSDALMDDYFVKFYGSKAGPFMKEYWLSIDKAFANMKCESGSFYALHLVYTPQFLRKLDSLVRKASDAAKDDPAYYARVAMTAQGLENAVQYIQVRDAMNRGDFTTAKRIYDELYAGNEIEQKKGYGNHYTLNYLNRFLGGHVAAGARATAIPNRVLQVLPDRMKLNYDPDDNGLDKGYHKLDFDDSRWRQVATYSNTLNAQGLPDIKSIMWYRTSIDIPLRHGRLSLFFTEVDGQEVTVYINGSQVASLGKQARRKPFEMDITEAAKPGKNTVAIRIDHRQITELFLGGIIRPVLLIAEP